MQHETTIKTRRGKLPYLAERDGYLGVVNVDGTFRRLRRATPPVPVTPEFIEKHIFQRWADLLKRLVD